MEFRAIPSLDYKYEINEDGTVFRNVQTKRENKIKLDKHHSQKGYYVSFVHIGGRKPNNYTKRIMIHKIVAECWLGACPENMEVDHKDRNSLNNHYSNLRYVTKSEQMKNRNHTNISRTGAKNLEKARKDRMVQVVVEKDGFKKVFESKYECAEYMSHILNTKSDSIRHQLKHDREFYKDYTFTYYRGYNK